MCDIEKLRNAVADARRMLNDDPHLAVFMVRDHLQSFDELLWDMAWAMHKDGYVTRSEAEYLLDRIDARLGGAHETG